MLVVASPNMVSSKLGLRMTTLHEETSNVGNQASTPINDDDEEKSDADYSEYDAYQVAYTLNRNLSEKLKHKVFHTIYQLTDINSVVSLNK